MENLMILTHNLYSKFSKKIVSRSNKIVTLNSTVFCDCRARFIKSISELQFLGFIKPTGRKTDHVVRLTWGTR